jgi:hypothetical protein
MAATAKIFMHGRSQAVRLPKEFRLPGKEVRVTKVGDKVILAAGESALRHRGMARGTRRRRGEDVPAGGIA